MNILASYNWIKEYLKTDLSVDEFAAKMTAAGNSVERMHRMGENFNYVVVGLIQTVSAHPNADKLRVTQVNVGKSVVQIVCGGSNLFEGQKVAVALPGASVKWHGEGEPVILKETEIRGEKSFGMICAAVELGFAGLPQGEKEIWDLTSMTDAKPGTDLADALDLDDVLLDIEVTTNRPDALGIVGQAREGYAAIGGKFVWKPSLIKKIPLDTAKPKVHVEDKTLCRKYEAVLMDGIKVGPSPWWLQKRLLLAGQKTVNNVVDVTNYVLLELGHPLHAFDADKIEGDVIHVRRAKNGETIQALDGKTRQLTEEMLVIADASKPMAVAGVIGDVPTSTTGKTTRILLESAAFNPVSVRKTARSLNLQTDASLLFEKGLSTEATGAALSRAVELIKQVAGGTVASDVFSVESKPYKAPIFSFDPQAAVNLLGVEVSTKVMTEFLKRLGFELKKKGKKFDVTVPYWRDHDIEGSQDFVEEIARLYGYANIPSMLPASTSAHVREDANLVWERRVKEALRSAGLTESYNYSFVSSKQLERYGIPVTSAVKISNPLSADQEYMRPTLVPSLLTVVEANQRRQPHMDLFEISTVHEPRKDDIPEQKMRLTMAFVGVDGDEGFRRAKGALMRLMSTLGIRTTRLERLASGTDNPEWHRTRSAAVWIDEHEHVGMIGEISSSIASNFGVEQPTFLVDLDFNRLAKEASNAMRYHPIPAFQEVKRDVAFVVDRKTEYGKIEQALKNASPLLESVELFDIYQGKGVPEGKKSLALHLAFRANDRTLSAEEVETDIGKLKYVLEKEFGAILRA